MGTAAQPLGTAACCAACRAGMCCPAAAANRTPPPPPPLLALQRVGCADRRSGAHFGEQRRRGDEHRGHPLRALHRHGGWQAGVLHPGWLPAPPWALLAGRDDAMLLSHPRSSLLRAGACERQGGCGATGSVPAPCPPCQPLAESVATAGHLLPQHDYSTCALVPSARPHQHQTPWPCLLPARLTSGMPPPSR